jgi:predicted O-methyltransferase YrrM
VGASAVVTRHEFLAALHDLIQPRSYLEIGVQHGTSLALAQPGTLAVGVDPNPQLLVDIGGAKVERVTSDDYFQGVRDATSVGAAHPFADTDNVVDLAFIDGMHLYEYALCDVANTERWAGPGTVIAIDDVLPRNQIEASRTQCLGDWTGDVWRLHPILREYRPDLQMALVDTQPTGILLAWGLNPADRILHDQWTTITDRWPLEDQPVPNHVLNRTEAVTPERALNALRHWRTA